ncbi:hypothetical protein LTR36_002069 [Oleoguttula mirabilis]|uniref:Altered inheritance of mitochondria protein 6 n=1 Tax=Oleoguttula mirabilis TaxID=1507867 RepID=A0AAV9JPB6_9PEZI|nr:hypothetical protein LTR36_002069 [Oleoguttula mirabilis]
MAVPCHSHNDYWRRVPLFDALHWGCIGVEADVWHFDDELYVGHNLASLTANRTFGSLYIDPLVKLLDSMNPSTEFTEATGHGVFDVDPDQTLVLLVDFKTNGRDTFLAVSQQLESLREKGYLSFWDGSKVNSRAVTVVGTGKTPFHMVVSNTTYRDIFFDAPLKAFWEHPKNSIAASNSNGGHRAGNGASLPASIEAASNQGKGATDDFASPNAFDTSTSYYASTSFASTIGSVWRGHLTPRQMDIIRGQIRGAKRRGLKVRYWDTPSWPVSLRNHIWHVLMKEGADMLNVDDLRAAAVEDWKRRTHD